MVETIYTFIHISTKNTVHLYKVTVFSPSSKILNLIKMSKVVRQKVAKKSIYTEMIADAGAATLTNRHR